MIKQCVKKPFTVLVAVILCLMLAAVSLTRMTTDLLPEMSMPYMIVITTYPGASPEKVESNVTEPLEGNLGTVSNVENVTSSSAENYSMVMLEFEDDTDMDSAMVKVNEAIQSTTLPDECGTPNVMEISMDMMATQYVSVSYDGMDIYELSDFVDETVVPYYERQEGVSTVTAMGLVDQTVEVRLNQDKIDVINNQLLAEVDEQLADALAEIEDAQAELDDAKAEVEDGTAELEEQENDTGDQLGEATLGLNTALATQAAYEAELASEQAKQAALQMELQAYEDAGITDSYEQMNALFASLQEAVSGEEAYNTIYDTVYEQTLIAAVQNVVDAQSTLESSGSSSTDSSTDSSADTSADSSTDTSADSSADSSEDTSTATTATTTTTTTTVTADNVDEILASMDESVASAIKEACKQAAEQAAQEQVETLASQYPSSVEEALSDSTKLAAAVALLEEQGQSEVAAQLTTENLSQLDEIVNTRIPNIEAELENLTVTIATAQAVCDSVSDAVSDAMNSYSTVEASKILAAAGFGSASAQLAAAQTSIESGQEQLDEAMESFEEARETALENANIDSLLEASTLSSIIYAQDFSMPAGYVDDEDDNQWMLKIGDGLTSLEEIEDLLLCSLDGVGDVRLADVADITVIDNAGESYTKVNGDDAVVLSVYKNSTAGTNAVSDVCNAAAKEMEAENEGLHIATLMDQGEYIDIFLQNILTSMVIGALLAVVVLTLFLKDVLPTIVVAFSIPFSVLVALLLMYFSDISINMMSLMGLSMGIGMLVDNSIVVIENIYRLRNRGLTAARSAVQGAKQVEGAIIASTLTTICVFLPMIFTSGMTRQMMLPFALTITFALLASLLVSLTVVPTCASVLLRKVRNVKHPIFDRMVNGYGKALNFCLRYKVVPLGLAIALLVFSVFGVTRMGMVLIPDMASDQIAITVTLDEDIDKDSSFAIADELTEKILTVDGVDTVGGLGNATALLSSEMSSEDYSTYTFYVLPDESVTREKQVYTICDNIEAAVADVKDAEVSVSASAMGSMSSMLGSGLEVNIYGSDLDTLREISEDFVDIISQEEGFTDVTNNQEDADQTLHLIIDRDAAMRLGLTNAQIYSQIATSLTTETTAVTVTIDDQEMDVVIVDERDLPTKENLLSTVFETTTTDDDGETVTEEHTLSEFAELETAEGLVSISRENNERYMTVSATTGDGYNTTKLTQQLTDDLESYEMPEGYAYEITGEYENVMSMMTQMGLMLALGLLFVYLVMVAQFQSLLSPFIVLFTVPLAFTGGFIGLLAAGEQLSMFAMMGFLVLMGTVVNNGIVFVDYTNQLRLGGMGKWDALVATGKTRMRPILMTAMTTILAMSAMIFDTSTSAGMSRGMAVVVVGGLLYATLMTLFIIPVMYDLLYRRQPKEVDVGSDDMDDAPDDAAEFIAQLEAERGGDAQTTGQN
ncbi:MAG: efflux RND transporter permease subunit [Clostridiales bacterium]|nr:efflux RND transporter permease subunit [Clostridiales bacterium]